MIRSNPGRFGPGSFRPGSFRPDLGVGRFGLGRWVDSALGHFGQRWMDGWMARTDGRTDGRQNEISQVEVVENVKARVKRIRLLITL